MKLTTVSTMLILACASAAGAQSRIDELCGPGHINEVAAATDVRANPGGYYVESLAVQLSHGDPRIIPAVGTEFHLCTSVVATPDMDANRAILMMKERAVKYLFVPVFVGETAPGF